MRDSIASPVSSRHAVLPDTAKASIAKANAEKADIARITAEIDWAAELGRAVHRAVSLLGWSQKEAAARLNVDERELAKWLSGERRPQFDRLFAVKELQRPLVICLAGLANGVVTTRIDFPEAVNA
jgi:ribosome-binding protein aMBF1 (putative translation factor)